MPLRWKVFARLNDYLNWDEVDVTFVQTQKSQSLFWQDLDECKIQHNWTLETSVSKYNGIFQIKNDLPYRGCWNSRRFSTYHSMEIQFSSLFPTPSPLYLWIPDFQGKNSRIPGLYQTIHEIPDFYGYFSCKMSRFLDLFYANLVWNFSQLSSLPLEFQIFLKQKNLYRGWPVFIWNSPIYIWPFCCYTAVTFF